MPRETIIWTALPNGVAGDGRLRLSVFVSPRLVPDSEEGSLSEFPSFHDWPSNIPSLQVFFEDDDGGSDGGTDGGSDGDVAPGDGFDDGPEGPEPSPAPTPHERVGPEPSSELWAALFGDDPESEDDESEDDESALVRRYEFDDFTNKRIRSFPVEHILRFLRERYADVAAAFPSDHPPQTHLLDPGGFRDVALNIPQVGDDVDSELDAELEDRHSLPPGLFDPKRDFARVKRFYRPAERVDELPDDPDRAFPDPELDFHEVVSLLSDFPAIQRRLGLVLDLLVDHPGSIGEVRVRVESAREEDESPWTAADLGGGGFAARSHTGELAGGYLDMQGHLPVQVDVDGAALKTISFASSIRSTEPGSSRRSADTPDRYSLPALRSAGISIVRPGRAVDYLHRRDDGSLTGRFERARDLNSRLGSLENPPELSAEEITQGYRVDVWDASTETWRSLCRRRGAYVFERTGDTLEFIDEGVVSEAMTEPVDDVEKDLRFHESIFRWSGWSLVAERPGLVLDENDQVVDEPEEWPEDDPEDDPADDFPMEASFVPVSRSLPKLRFGETYRVRARAVDLAGNSLPFDDPEDAFATEALLYGRFEPVLPPALLPRHPVTEGESLERLVLRSNFDTPAEGTSERHLAPPKAFQLQIEQHGLLDTPDGLDVDAYDMLAEGDAATYDDHPLAEPDPNNHDKPFFDTDNLQLPYLPDVMSRGVSFRWFGETTSASLDDELVDFYRSKFPEWPKASPFRLVVEEGPRDWRFEGGTFVVSLEKADVARVRYSSFFEEHRLELMGLWGWLEERFGGDVPDELRERVLRGLHWMFTPFRELTVVHAVRQPLLTPEFDPLVAERDPGATFAGLRGVARVSRKSTERLDLKGSWTEFIDDVREDAPREQPRRGHVGRLPVEIDPADRDSTTLPIDSSEVRHEFGDTKHRLVDYSAEATTRFAEYFTRRERHVLPTGSDPAEAPADALVLDADGVVPESETVKGLDDAGTSDGDAAARPAYARDDDYAIDYESGEIWRLEGGGIGADEEVEIAFIVPPVTRETAEPITVSVPSSKRPEAPDVLYAIPTLALKGETRGRRHELQRAGVGVRVYLERPWWSSGVGELLGVVTNPHGRSGDRVSCEQVPEQIRDFITLWGRDPLGRGKAPPDVPLQFDFPRAVETPTRGLLLAERGRVPGVFVAGHEVDFDADRGLWSCDIDIDTGGADRPFVRLALARYQPHSVLGKELSPVILADVVQLAPTRTITIIELPEPATSRVRAIFVTPGPAQHLRDKRVEIVRMERVGSVKGDLGFRPMEDTTVELKRERQRGRSRRGGRDERTRDDDHVRWSGEIDLPKDRDEPTRFLVREFDGSSEPSQALPFTIDF